VKRHASKLRASELGIGSWTIVIVLLALLAGAVSFAYYGWTYETGEAMPVSLYIPMTLGIVFSLIVGIGLMALMFYSSRKGYDEPPQNPDKDAGDR
jgi:hypothetical protein